MLARRLSDELLDRNAVFVVVRWEELSMALNETRAQDRYLDELEKCDGLIALFGKTVGSYMKEELQLAINRLRQGQLPKKILVCFEKFTVDLPGIDQGIRDVIALKEKLERLGQVYAVFDSDEGLRNIVEREGRHWVRDFASTTDLFQVTEEMINIQVEGMPVDVTAKRRVFSEREVGKLCKRLGLRRRDRVNGHLAFVDGDVSYFARLEDPASRLEAKLRARKLILNQAEKLNIRIWRQGQLSYHSNELEALLMDRWLKRVDEKQNIRNRIAISSPSRRCKKRRTKQ